MKTIPLLHQPRLRKMAMAILAASLSVPAMAEEVRLFTQPPSADEMGRLLFPDKAVGQRPKLKTRSLTFTTVSKKSGQSTQPASKETTGIALPIQFAFNSAELLGDARAYLNEVGKMLSMEQFKDERIVLEGHTDAIGSEDYNHWLSKKRAESVKAYLTSKFGIDPKRLVVVGRGEQEPLPGRNPTDGINRRVELHRANKLAAN